MSMVRLPGRWWGVGAVGDRARARAGTQPYLGPRPWPARGRRHDGWWGDPARGSVAAARSIGAVHDLVVAAGAGVEPAAAHLGDKRARRAPARLRRSHGLLADLTQQVIAALEQF